MNSGEQETPASPAPRGGLQLMALILVVLAALAVYSNWQRAHRDRVETVTIVPAVSSTPSPAPALPNDQ